MSHVCLPLTNRLAGSLTLKVSEVTVISPTTLVKNASAVNWANCGESKIVSEFNQRHFAGLRTEALC